jgi:SnoaL-like domain/Aspartyl protease
MRLRILILTLSTAILLLPGARFPQSTLQPAASPDEIPLERCDRLPVVKIRIGSSEMRFLVDTGATSMLNLKSFAAGRTKEMQVTSWSGTAATSAREVSIAEFVLGNHRLQNLKLPAIDLSPIGKACGGPIDGILGVDLLDKMEVTIDLKRQIASLGGEPSDPDVMYAEMEDSMHQCIDAFQQGNAAVLAECFDPQIVFYTPDGEFVGRDSVVAYLRDHYFQYAPALQYCMKPHEMRAFGDALWYSYDYSIETPKQTLSGHGFAMCHRSGKRWRMLNLHNSLAEPVKEAANPS